MRDGIVITFDGDGLCFSGCGECLLFPSKEHRTWEDWQMHLLKQGDYIAVVGDTDENDVYRVERLDILIYAYSPFGDKKALLPKDCQYADANEIYQFQIMERKWEEGKLGSTVPDIGLGGSDSTIPIHADGNTRGFSPTGLQPFDKVLVRNCNGLWMPSFFSSYVHEERVTKYVTIGGSFWDMCVPYNAETAYLTNTKMEYEGKYKLNMEEKNNGEEE